MKRSTMLLIIAVLMVGVAAGAFFLLRGEEPEEQQRAAAIEAAERWIRNNSPTFVYDGTDLELREVDKSAREGEGPAAYEMVFEFDSRHSGYGDREGEMLAQVITPHTLAIRLEKGADSGRWEVTRAVNDGVFDEIAGTFLEEPGDRDTRRLELFFMRVEEGQEEAVAVSREVSAEGALEVNALEALLKGPRPKEKEKGYYSSIPEGVEIEQFEIRAATAYVSFSAQMDKDVAGSARVQAIREQVRLTLRQFEHIQAVEIAVEGQTEGILQP